ncbi:hypothetical protein [Clostridium sp. DJ247]|uniref:hypothetical protein n=1 Tax=Clostridium sp. DJ247 TaxID=2726188 RepID=UPI00162532EA|nr:hypothetical protein [Clostridium sp. DJ247]MBC2579141.1 hypothetical protein [Clostridium sp. DJ247]
MEYNVENFQLGRFTSNVIVSDDLKTALIKKDYTLYCIDISSGKASFNNESNYKILNTVEKYQFIDSNKILCLMTKSQIGTLYIYDVITGNKKELIDFIDSFDLSQDKQHIVYSENVHGTVYIGKLNNDQIMDKTVIYKGQTVNLTWNGDNKKILLYNHEGNPFPVAYVVELK